MREGETKYPLWLNVWSTLALIFTFGGVVAAFWMPTVGIVFAMVGFFSVSITGKIADKIKVRTHGSSE